MRQIDTHSFARPLWRGALIAGTLSLHAQAQPLDVVYEPTPHETVQRMLSVADVRSSDLLIDLGSGDGRIAIAAGRRGARALGVELNPDRVREATAKAQAAGLGDRVSFRQQDLFKTSLANATVIALYLLPELNIRLRPHLLALRPGTRIVSHRFSMGDWDPDVTDTDGGTVYMWIVPAGVSGRWKVRHGEQTFDVEFKQQYQTISGTALLAGGASSPIREARLRGNEIEFSVNIAGRTTRFSGTVSGASARGVSGGFGLGQAAADWSATRF